MTGLNESVIAKAFGLPSEGQRFCESTVLASGVDTEKNRWFVITDGTVQRTAAQAALKPSLNRTKYFTHDDRVFEAISGSKFQMEVVRTNPSGGVQTVIGGSMSYTRVRKNPVSVADFRSEMKDMFVSDPRRDFKEYDAPKLHSEAFRDRLFTFVSYRGESYGWVKGGKIYHRRGSLIMPKLKVNKAVEGATVFYHTHPSKDEPSLSSADDYQFYADLAFAFGIKHFYTIMENRIDHFTFTVKKSKEEDYLKMDEDKLLDDFNSMIDEAEASVTKKHKGNKNMTDEKFYETITRGAVTKMNSRFKQFFTISYKGHAKPGLVRENPGVAGFRHNPPVRISHIHRASQLDELRDTTNNYEHYGANEFGHSHYVYWWIDHHFSATPAHPKARLWKLKEYGLSDEARRKLRAYMSEEVAPGYSKLDILLFLALYHDVGKKREKEEGRHHSIIGAEMFRDEISVELKLPEQVTDTVVHLMMTDVGRKNIDPEVFRTKAGDYLGVAYMLQLADMLAHHPFMYTSYAAEAKEQGLIDKANVHRYKQFAAEQHISNVTKFLNSRVINNPPPKAVSAYFSGSFDTVIDGDIAEIEFSEWEDPDKKMFYNAQLRMRDPVHGVKVTLFLSSGKFIIYFGKDSNRIEGDATFYDTAMDIYRRMGDILSNFTTGMDYDSPPEPDIMVNPRHVDKVHLITISGPSGVGKSTIAKTLAGILDADLIPTVTTRSRRPKEKGNRDRIFIKEKQFKEMIEEGAFVEWKRLKNGFYYGRRYSDFKKPVAVIDVTLKGMNKYRDVFPHTTSIFLDPDVPPEELKKRILRRGGMTPEEAEARANIAAKQIEDAHKMDFDMFVKSKTGGFEDVAKQIADDIEIIKQNPPELLPVYDCETCGVKGMTHTNWYCKDHGQIKQNVPIFDALPSPEEYVARRIQAGSKLTPNGHQFRNTISSTRAPRERVDLRREIVSLAFTKKVDDIYQPFKQDAIREGWSAIRKHVARVKDGGIFRWNENFPEDWNDKVWTIDEMIENGGVCRHLGMLSGLLLERAIEEGVLKGQVYYFRGVGHGWALYRDRMGRDQIVDPAQSYWGPMGEKEYYGGEHDLNGDGKKTSYYEPYSKRSNVPDNLPVRQLRGLQAQASPEMKAMLRSNPKEGPDLFSHFERWAKLVNMKNKELKAFLDSPLGKVAGLSPQEAKEQGIFSGRVSGRRILKMRAKIGLGGPKDYIKGPRHLEEKWEEALKKWTGPSKNYMKGTTDWDWCLRQVRFNERHGAFPYNSAAEERKGPLVRKQKTQNQVSRRLLSLWVWGHDPWRWARKHGIARMPKCPDVPWIGMTEKRKYGKVPVLMKSTKKNPQTGLPGIGDPPVDPATIQPHLDWPKWTKPDWFPRNLVPQSAVYSPPRTTSLRGKRVTSTPFYYIRQDELDRLLQSQQYLELQEADRQRKIAEAERIRAQHQGTVEDYRTNPSNIPFPVPEEYQEELERRLTEEMTAEGYRPLRVQQDFIDSGGYDDAPSDWSYVQGEYQEFLDEIEAQDWDEAYAEYSDVEGHTAYYLWTNYRIDMPVYTHDHIDKVLFRIRIFEDLFAHYGFDFGPEYLKGGSNYEKVFKVRNALDAAADAQGKPRVKDDDEQLGAVVKRLVAARKARNNPAPMGLEADFEAMKRTAKRNRELEMTEGFDAHGWWKSQKGIIDEKYGKEPVAGASWLMPVFDPDFDPYADPNSIDDFHPDGQPNMHFYNQLMRIPQTEPPTPRKILQIALNIGQGQASGIVDEDYTMSDFIAFDNPPPQGYSLNLEAENRFVPNEDRVVRSGLKKRSGPPPEPRTRSTRQYTYVDDSTGRVMAFVGTQERPEVHYTNKHGREISRGSHILLYFTISSEASPRGLWRELMNDVLRDYGHRTMVLERNSAGAVAHQEETPDYTGVWKPNTTIPDHKLKEIYDSFGFRDAHVPGYKGRAMVRLPKPIANPRTPGGKKFPTKYLKGLTAFEKMIAEDEIDKGYKYDADDPEAYKFWKSDIKATARGLKIGSSKHRTKYYKMYRKNIDKDYKPSGSSPKEKFLNRIRKETKIKRSILEKIYDKGLAAWRVGHRPGVAQHQWAAGRVYAFAVGADSSTGKGKPDHKLAVEAGVR